MSWHRERLERAHLIARTLLKHMSPEQQKAAIDEIVTNPDVAAELIEAMNAADEILAALEEHRRAA